jgi:hypothetical protein
VIVDRDGYVMMDLKNKIVRQVAMAQASDGLNTLGDDPLTELHMRNFLDAVRTGAKLTAPIAEGAKTGLLCHLGTIAQQTKRTLRIDPKTGHILADAEAAARWDRTYEPGWAPTMR